MGKKIIPVSIISTVLNESKTILELLDSLQKQTVKAQEIIIIDGGSVDTTYQLLQDTEKRFDEYLKVIVKQGNRSAGRNAGIKIASQQIIVCTDAGCIPEPTWLEKLYERYLQTNCPVVAGYYTGNGKTSFEKAVVPYALVMPDKVDPKNFLPATRSVLFEKEVWNAVGRFDEELSDNEDYAFAHAVKAKNFPIAFTHDAVVVWKPRSTLKSFYTMIFRFARGDIQAGLLRPKVILLFGRYILGTLLCIYLLRRSIFDTLLASVCIAFLYAIWSIMKNKKYVGGGWVWLPLLQVSSDFAVIHGSIEGFYKWLFGNRKYNQQYQHN